MMHLMDLASTTDSVPPAALEGFIVMIERG